MSNNTNNFIMINCHQCQKVKNIEQMLTCSNNNCRESYCFNCIRMFYVSVEFLFKKYIYS